MIENVWDVIWIKKDDSRWSSWKRTWIIVLESVEIGGKLKDWEVFIRVCWKNDSKSINTCEMDRRMSFWVVFRESSLEGMLKWLNKIFPCEEMSLWMKKVFETLFGSIVIVGSVDAVVMRLILYKMCFWNLKKMCFKVTL